MIFHPAFPEDRIKQERAIVEGSVLSKSDYTPWELAELKLDDMIFQMETLQSLGTHETLSSITLQDLRDWHAHYFHPQNTLLVVAGNLEEDEIEAVLDKVDFPSSEEIRYSYTIPKKLVRDRFFHQPLEIEKPEIWVGFKVSHEDWAPLTLLKIILDNYPLSRLFKQLRVEEDLAYMVDSSFKFTSDGGRFGIYIGALNGMEVPALRAISSLIEELKVGKLTEDELNWAKKVYKLELFKTMEDPGRAIEWLGRMNLWQRNPISFADAEEVIEQYTIEELVETAQKIFVEWNCYVSMVGGDGNKVKGIVFAS